MSLQILKLLIETACADGIITDREYSHLKEKADELEISHKDLDFLIESELDRIKSLKTGSNFSEQSSKSFPENQQTNADQNLSSGFQSQNDLASGFVSIDETQNQSNIPENPDNALFTNISLLSEQGAMSSVYKAKRHNRWVVVKRLRENFRDNETFKTLFFREFENSVGLSHPNIVNIYDKGEDKEGLYYYMEYIDGQPLSKLITRKGIKENDLVKKISLQILDALDYVHKKQIFHRDLKPENILITFNGNNVKLVDFGLAKADDFPDEMKKVGTPLYAAPEQTLKGNKADGRADIYSFGLILLEMLTGQLADKELARPRNEDLYNVIIKSTQANVDDRYNDCLEIIDELKKISFESEKPELQISNSEIDFGKVKVLQNKVAKINIYNKGTGTLKWAISTKSSYVSLYQADDYFKIDFKPAKIGEYLETIDIKSNGGDLNVVIKARVQSQVRKTLVGIGIILLLIALGYSIYNYLPAKYINEELYWKKVKFENSIDSYNKYISNFPNGIRKTEAELLRNKLIKEYEDWNNAVLSNTKQAFDEYLTNYPVGKHAELAKDKRGRLSVNNERDKEDKFWETSKDRDNLDYYNEYLIRYPKGKYAFKAKLRIEELKREISGKEVTDSLNFATGPADIVKRFLNDIGRKDYIAAYSKTENKEWNSYKYFSSGRVYGQIQKIKILKTDVIVEKSNKATIYADYQIWETVSSYPKGYKEYYFMQKFKDDWKIIKTTLIEQYSIDN